jgi:branched-chain amino acid transport system ATP-binding protein
VLLDEPSEGLAPVIVELMATAVAAMKQDGVAVLLCEQNFWFASAVADRAAIIEQGQIRYEGPMAALRRMTRGRRLIWRLRIARRDTLGPF